MDNHSDKHEPDANHPMGFLAGLLLGSLAGAGAMLLLAPQSGKRTRAHIQLKGMELRDQAAEAMDEAVAQTRVKARQIKTGVREKAEELQERGQAMLDEGRARGSAVVGAGRPPGQ